MTRSIYYRAELIRADLTQADLTQGRVDLHSGSVVECLTRDKHAGGSSLTGVTALWSLSKTLILA